MRLGVVAAILISIAPLAARAQNPYDDPPPEETEFTEPGELEAGDALPEPEDDSTERGVALGNPVEDEGPIAIAVAEERDLVTGSPRTMLGPNGSVFLETGLTRGRWPSTRIWAESTELGFRYRLADEVIAEVSWALTWGHALVIGETTIATEVTPYNQHVDRVEPANPTLGGFFVHRASMVLLEIGLTMSIPMASRDDVGTTVASVATREASAEVNRAAMAMRGYRGAYRYAAERISFAIPFRVVFPAAPLVFDIDGGVAVMIPVLGDRNGDVDVLIDLGLGVATHVYGPLYLGVRLGGVGSTSGTAVPAFTLSGEPFARLRFDPVQITLRGVMNLAGDDAIGGERGPSFGLFLGAGLEF